MVSVDSSLSHSFAKLQVEDKDASIILYNGKGVSPASAEAVQVIISTLLRAPVQLVTEKFFQDNEAFGNAVRNRKIKLIIFVGALSTQAVEEGLGMDGLANLAYAIRVFKIPYFGICAGAYLVSRNRQFEEVEIERRRYKSYKRCDYPDIFKGWASGPVLNEKVTLVQPSECIRKLSVITPKEIVNGYCVYFNGPSFYSRDMSGIKVLGRFITNEDLPLTEQPAAIIHCTDNGINAVLCGPHPEFLQDPSISPAFSYTIFHTMLTALGFFKKERSMQTFLKGIGLKKKETRNSTECTGIEKLYALPTSAHFLISAYVQDAKEKISFLGALPSFQKATTELCYKQFETLRDKLIKVIGFQFTDPSSLPFEERFFTPYTHYSLDKRKLELLRLMHASREGIKVGLLVDRCFQSIIPGSAQYDNLETYVYVKEAEIARPSFPRVIVS